MFALRTLLVLLAAVLWTGSLSAAEAPKAARCTFEFGVFVEFKKGEFNSEDGGKTSFVIAAIDRENGSAQLIGNLGATPLAMVPSPNHLHFVEQTQIGSVNLTTIFSEVKDSRGFLAVHSRHTGLPTDPMISQYYGFCKAL